MAIFEIISEKHQKLFGSVRVGVCKVGIWNIFTSAMNVQICISSSTNNLPPISGGIGYCDVAIGDISRSDSLASKSSIIIDQGASVLHAFDFAILLHRKRHDYFHTCISGHPNA